ncbi:hypothetical protein PAXRUDRAFT_784599 [Paxillus rubicundulus Ve08.2h10]|uniref:Uncharacterized protein n=1 Tax=Paxillus rubicundulus Ve08.2h10 TaxID=930991 RepID=A0A0D0DPW0_9AGAM|nr:hypothetical protein PAXRUDRAFT_784599 [Paxillus rubicundulus Ve08.2h10]
MISHRCLRWHTGCWTRCTVSVGICKGKQWTCQHHDAKQKECRSSFDPSTHQDGGETICIVYARSLASESSKKSGQS